MGIDIMFVSTSKSTKIHFYYSFCFLITVVYFSSIVYNVSIAEEDLDEDNNNNPPKSESTLLRRRHRKDISMTEYVQLKLRDLSKKPWQEILKSPLVRNYLLLIGLVLMVLIVFFTYAVYKQY